MIHTKRAAFDRLRGSNWVGMRVRAATNRLPGGRERVPLVSEGNDAGTDGMQVQVDSYENNKAGEVVCSNLCNYFYYYYFANHLNTIHRSFPSSVRAPS